MILIVNDPIKATALDFGKTSNVKLYIPSIKIGGLRYSERKQKLSEHVDVDENDLENLRKIESIGVEVEFRMLPRDKKHTITKDY